MSRNCLPITLVEKHNEKTNVQKARRIPGTILSTGTFLLGPTLRECALGKRGEEDRALAPTLDCLIQGLRYLETYQDTPAVRFPLQSAQGQAQVQIVWMRDHDVLADCMTDENGMLLRLDTGWVDALRKVESKDEQTGLTVLGAVVDLYILVVLGGAGQREALHVLRDFIVQLPKADMDALHQVLQGTVLDHNNSFSLMITLSEDTALAMELEKLDLKTLLGVRTNVLYETGNHLEHELFKQRRNGGTLVLNDCLKAVLDGNLIAPEEIDALVASVAVSEELGQGKSLAKVSKVIEENLKWRDRWITWLIGQTQVDMPYNQTNVIKLIKEPMEDVDEKRALINEAISSEYDMDTEGENIARISRWARDTGKRLVAGRLSRAFGNQSQLLSVAKILADKEGLLPYVKALYSASMAEPALQTHASRLLHLIQQKKPTPFAQTVGALNAYEEALFDYQTREFKKMLVEKDEAARRIVGRPSAETCNTVLNAIQSKIQNLYRVAADFRDQLEKTRKDPASFIILLQRLHPAETVNLANANLLRDVHPGKEDDLRDLMRQGGHFTYSTPGLGRVTDDKGQVTNTNWILEVDDWIEAIPLFIHERVVKRLVKVGKEEIEVEIIETEVDQEAMEAFFRFHAEFWAGNIEAVMDSEHVGLARQLLVRKDEDLSRAAEAYRHANPDKTENEAAYFVTKDQTDLHQGITCLAALIAKGYRDEIDKINLAIEKDTLSRIEAVEKIVVAKAPVSSVIAAPSAEQIATNAVAKAKGAVAADARGLMKYTTMPTRHTSSLHILTTESAGMTEGYVQTWIEEEMALFNVIRAEGLEDEVNQKMGQFRTRIQAIGKKVIAEFGMSVVIDEVMAQQRLPEPAAVLTVLTSYKPVMQEAAKLAVLIEYDEKFGKRKVQFDNAKDPKQVVEYLEKNKTQLMKIAVPKVAENNGKAFEQRLAEFGKNAKKASLYQLQKQVIDSETDYQEELEALLIFEARNAILEQWNQDQPQLKLLEQVKNYIRIHTMLAKSTARKRVLSEHQLNALCMHPLHYYQATGGNKRYNLLYTPSRVNLGERERDSVVKWRQWVGGADAAAAQAGFEFYSLINEGGVEERPALAYAEIQKTSENALCVTHFAGSNALALLCMAVLEGDAEDMADQMNLRNDRYIPPAGEGYGGYCVPKDGLFLAFVLSLQNEVKLRQMGIPERYHTGVMKMAKEVLLHQHDFESYFDWQRWAAEKLLQYKQLKTYFDFKDDMMVFHLTKIARAVENLGQPWHETTPGDKLVANLAARWGVEHMIIHAEQVNRFMVFYKAWMIYDALREARQDNPLCPAEQDAVVALTAEYKPVQDIRFSTGMRLFEILAQTHEHLTYCFDEEGQNLAQLMFLGFNPHSDHPMAKRAAQEVISAFHLDPNNKEIMNRMKEAFPAHKPVGDLIMTSVTMSSTQDLLFYTSDTKLDEIGMQVQVILGDYGLTEDQIRANATVHGGHLRRWAGIKELPSEEQDDLIRRVGGHIHALVLQMRGPGREYETDIQGIDVLNTGIPFPQLIELLDDMPKVVALMRNGNPNSALAIVDGAAGRARRVLTYNDIQLFFAACEQIGRRGVYRSVGLGRHIIERLREEMHKKRARALALYNAVAAVAEKQDDKTINVAWAMYQQMSEAITAADEAGKALREEEKLKRYKKWKPRYFYMSQALAKISAGLKLQQLDFGTWLAGIGGMFVVQGEPQKTIDARRTTWEKGMGILFANLGEVQSEVQPFIGADLETLIAGLVRPEYAPDTQQFAQQMLVESSSKAVEIAAREALERRKALKVRAERAKAFNNREDGFREALQSDFPSFEICWDEGQQILQRIWNDVCGIYKLSSETPERGKLRSKVNIHFGRFIAQTRMALSALVMEIMPETNPAEKDTKRKILADLATVYTGREIIFEELKKLAGGYEDIGGIARLAEAAHGDREKLARIAQGIEMFYITFALAQVLEFALQLPDEIDPAVFWKNLVDFFAESINDHWYEYWPWAYSRGIGFRDIPTEEKYALAVERHAWLYKFIRALLIERTELAQRPVEEQDALLGNYTGGKKVVAIGANGSCDIERQWRAYNQLREITFVKSDGFPIPEVFDPFDPAIIEADTRVNVTFLFPVGRTHVSRALREGPTLNRILQEQKKPGANLMITRYNDFRAVEGAERQVILVTDGHFYISEAEYLAALVGQGLKKSDAQQRVKEAKADGRLTAKGIRIAARFKQNGTPAPVVAGALIPFHGTPLYINGQSEAEGMPATIQSQIYTDVTYDKSLYPGIYTEETGVHLPPEIDWMQDWNNALSADAIQEKVKEGYADKGFKGLREFAKDYPIVLIKGAAESGARNLKVFEIQDDRAQVNEEELNNAARFVYDVSRGQNVVIQAAIFTNPELWASPELMESFVDRQVLDWNTPVNRDTYPRSQIYGSMRIVASSSSPKKKYDTAFPISLMSLQVATNVGRGGTLEPLYDDLVLPQFRKQIIKGLHEEGPKMMKALTAFIEKYGPEWEAKTGKKVGQDLRGVPYSWANYLMGDYVITPVFKRRGRLVDIQPVFDGTGRRIGSKPILQDAEGRFEGEIVDWKFIHLEPNVGIGLWDRYNLREEFNEKRQAEREKRPFNPDHVGQSDRIVLKNYVLAGEEYLKANFGKKGIQREAVNKAVK